MCTQVGESFKEMSQHLFDRPNSIEELTEQREYIGSIPEKVTENQVSIVIRTYLPILCMYDCNFVCVCVYVRMHMWCNKGRHPHTCMHACMHRHRQYTHMHTHTHTCACNTHRHTYMYVLSVLLNVNMYIYIMYNYYIHYR